MKGTIMLLGGLLLLGGCASQPSAPVAVVEAATATYGGCIVGSAADQFTDVVAQHLMVCGGDDGFAQLLGVVVTCWADLTVATLTPAAGVRLRDIGWVSVRYRADKAAVQHDARGWNATDGGGAITREADTVERLLVSLAGATDQFVFQIANTAPLGNEYSHTVELIETDAAGAVADLRARCAGFEETG